MENKYYTPNIDDIYVGYEFEMDDTWGGWMKLTFTEEMLKAEPLVPLGSGSERAPWYHRIRTPYLTKEQLEKEGWIQNKLKYQFEKDIYLLYIANGDDFETVGLNHEIVIVNKRFEDSIFRGRIPSINEYRYICKLLNI